MFSADAVGGMFAALRGMGLTPFILKAMPFVIQEGRRKTLH